MKFVVTGAAGHVSKPLAELLLSNKHEVTVISRKAENVAELVRQGAKAAIGDLQDVPFLGTTPFSRGLPSSARVKSTHNDRKKPQL